MIRFPVLLMVLIVVANVVQADPSVLNHRQKPQTGRKKVGRKPMPTKVMPGGLRWQVRNLDVPVTGSSCYEGKEANCSKYGRVYTFEAAQKVCALAGAGWRLPGIKDWESMVNEFGGFVNETPDSGKNAFRELMVGGSAGFDAVAGGGRNPDGSYARLDAHAFYWTSSEAPNGDGWFINFGKGAGIINRHNGEKSRAFAVRCVKDEKAR